MPTWLSILRITRAKAPTFALLAGIVAASAPALAAGPDSPEVMQMSERALRWLDTQEDNRLGARCLIGLSLYKAGRKLDHPKVVAARQACEASMNADVKSLDNYSAGLALFFLLEPAPERNRSLPRRYVDEILRRQQR